MLSEHPPTVTQGWIVTGTRKNYGGNQISVAVNRKPDEKMCINWGGDQPEILANVEIREIQ